MNEYGNLLDNYSFNLFYKTKKGIFLSPSHFIRNDWGKPSIFGLEGIHFNISHSHDYVVCGISSLPIGIDVEAVREINTNIANRFFLSKKLNTSI